MNEQVFINELRGGYYLRQPKSNRPTNIYFIVNCNGKQCRYATNVKIYPKQWNKRKQLAVISNTLTPLDNCNNKIVNDKINFINQQFIKYKMYICSGETNKTLKEYIYMKNEFNAVDIISSAFDIYCKENKTLAEGSLQQYENAVNKYIGYLTDKNLINNKDVFNQFSLNDYQKYLSESGNYKASTINNYMFGFIITLVNSVITQNSKYKNYNISIAKNNTIKEPKQDNEIKRIALTDEEVKAIENCKGLTDTEKKYRNVFLLQCECGQRISDIIRILADKYTTHIDKYGMIALITKKEGTTSFIKQSDRFKMLLSKIDKGTISFAKENYDKKVSSFTSMYNIAIKDIAKKAELNRIISLGNKGQFPICEKLTTHDARRTFVTKCDCLGMNNDEKKIFTGHKGKKEVIDKYNLTSIENIAKKANDIWNKYFNTYENGINEIFAYDKIMAIKDILNNDINGYDTPMMKDVISEMKDTSKLSQYEVIDEKKAKDIDSFMKEIALRNKDANLYAIYQYKLKYYGFIDEIMDISEIEVMFNDMETERTKDIESKQNDYEFQQSLHMPKKYQK